MDIKGTLHQEAYSEIRGGKQRRKGNAIRNTPQSFSQSLELSGEYKGVGKIEPPRILTKRIYRKGAKPYYGPGEILPTISPNTYLKGSTERNTTRVFDFAPTPHRDSEVRWNPPVLGELGTWGNRCGLCCAVIAYASLLLES